MEKGRYQFKVRSYECGPDGRVTLPNVCNYLQEAASLNAEELGFSKSNFESAGSDVSWVLTRLVVKMNRYPTWEDEVTVETFPRGGRKIVAWRDFELKDAKGVTLGVASSEWMLIDLATRKIAPIPQKVIDSSDPANVPVLGLEPFSRFRFPEDVERLSPGGRDGTLRFTAQKSQIDLNGHVNNVHYVAWMLEPLPNACPSEMEIVFRSETFSGDEVRVEASTAGDVVCHRVCAPDGREHAVARIRA